MLYKTHTHTPKGRKINALQIFLRSVSVTYTVKAAISEQGGRAGHPHMHPVFVF